jgi:hypothetical protein
VTELRREEGTPAAGSSMSGPEAGMRAGRHRVGEKKIKILAEMLPKLQFYSRSTFLSSRTVTGGSNVRGKADPNWVRKVFNCLRSL